MNWFHIFYSLLLVAVSAYEHYQPVTLTPADCTMQGWHQQIDALPDPAFPQRLRTGDELLLIGIVRDAETCAPIANAAVMFDLANAEGEYDGVQQGTAYTNASGLFIIQINRPGAYGGGTPHIHLFTGAQKYQPITASYNMIGAETLGWIELTLMMR